MWSNTISVRLAIGGAVLVVLAFIQNAAVQADSGETSRFPRASSFATRPVSERSVRLRSAAVRQDRSARPERLVAFHGRSGHHRYGHRRYGAYRYGYRGYRYGYTPRHSYGYSGYGYSPFAYGYRFSPYGYPFSYGYARPYQYRSYPYASGYSYRPWSSYYYRPWYYRPYSYFSYGYSYGIPWYRYSESYGARGSAYVPAPGVSGYGGPVRYYGTYGYGCAPDCDE